MVEAAELLIHLLRNACCSRQAVHRDNRKLQPLGLVDGHDLHVAGRKRSVLVLELVHAGPEDDRQHAPEQRELHVLLVAPGDDVQVVVGLEGVQHRRENREVPGSVLILHVGYERFLPEQAVEDVGEADAE